MKKKYCILFLLAFGIASKGNSVKPAATEQYYVMTTSGLNLRLAPDKRAQVISTIPFGTKVSTLKWAELEASPKTEVVNGLKGSWAPVTYDNKVGYVFSGYLSRMPAPKPGRCAIDAYFDDNYGISKPDVEEMNVRSDEAKSFGNELKNFKRIRRTYRQNIVLIQEGADDFWLQTYTFKDRTIQELYLFGSACMKPSTPIFQLDEKKSMQVYGQGPCSLRIFLDRNESPTLEWSCSG